MTSTPRKQLLAALLFTLGAACGQAELVVDENGELLGADEAGLATPPASSSETGEQCLTFYFVGWQSQVVETQGETQQGGLVLKSRSYDGVAGRTHHSNGTTSPITATPATQMCTTSTASMTVSSAHTGSIGVEIDLGLFKLKPGYSYTSGSSQTQTTSHCVSVGAGQRHRLEPGDELFCTHFNGDETSTYEIPQWRDDRRVTQHRKVYRSRVICLNMERYGPWFDGSTTVTRVALPPLEVSITAPFVSTSCSTVDYPAPPR